MTQKCNIVVNASRITKWSKQHVKTCLWRVFCGNYPNWFHWGHQLWFSTHSLLYEWLTNAERCFNALSFASKLYVPSWADLIFSTFRDRSLSSNSDIIKSQSQRQLGQSNKLYCNADLMPSPAAHGVSILSWLTTYMLKLDTTEAEWIDKLSWDLARGNGSLCCVCRRDEVSGIFWADTNNFPPAVTKWPQGFI